MKRRPLQRTTTPAPSAFAYGAPVELSVLPSDAEGGPWCVLAYEVELKGYRKSDGSFAKITSADIDAMVKNFDRYPKSPLVVEHADTREGLPSEWATPHGHIVALRTGTMERKVGALSKTVKTLEGRIDAPPDVRLAINGDPTTATPPTWPFCSITTAAGVDDETGLALGTVLHSVSLTAHPRLADLPRLAAAKDPMPTTKRPNDPHEHGYWYGDIATRGDVLSMLRCVLDLPVTALEADVLAAVTKLETLASQPEEQSGVDTDDLLSAIRRALGLDALQGTAEVVAAVRTALTTLPGADGATTMSRGLPAANTPPTEKPTMKTFMELAAQMKLPAVATEEAARDAVLSLAADGAAVRTTLSLAVDAPLAPKLAELVTAGAELPKVREELSTLRAQEKARVEAEAKAALERAEASLVRRVDEVCLAKGYDDDVKPALLAFGRSDRAGFDAKYPAASVQELGQRAQDAERTRTVAAAGTKVGDKPADPGAKVELSKALQALQGVYRRAGYELTTAEALDHHQRGETPEDAARELGLAD